MNSLPYHLTYENRLERDVARWRMVLICLLYTGKLPEHDVYRKRLVFDDDVGDKIYLDGGSAIVDGRCQRRISDRESPRYGGEWHSSWLHSDEVDTVGAIVPVQHFHTFC